MKLGGIFQGLKGRGMLVRLEGKFDPYRCEVSQQCQALKTHLHPEAVMFLPHLQAALTTSPNDQSPQLPPPLPTYTMCPSTKRQQSHLFYLENLCFIKTC